MFTIDSKIKDVYAHPVGHDMLEMAFHRKGWSDKFFQTRLAEHLKLRTLQKLPFHRLDRGFLRALIRLLNEHGPLGKSLRKYGSWWDEAVIYRIFLRSFCDADRDGAGDIGGLLSKLDYLQELGIDVLLLGSALDSPAHSGGQDVRNFRMLQKFGGNESSIEELVLQIHDRGMKLIIEIPANRTSDEHEWFLDDEDGHGGKCAKYYHHRKEPNNWTSMSGGSAFPYKGAEERWDLRLSSESEPELNWDNEELRREMAEVCRFWLDKGADGIYLSGAGFISKHEGLPYGSEGVYALTGHCGYEHYFFGPKLPQYLCQLRKELFEPRGALLIGQTPGLGSHMCRLLTDSDVGALDIAVSDEPLRPCAHRKRSGVKYDLEDYKKYILRMMLEHNDYGVTPLLFENDRIPRMISRIEPQARYQSAAAKMLGTLLMTLKGTPILYQGEELGATDVRLDSPDQLTSIQSKTRYDVLRDKIGTQKAQQRMLDEAPELAWVPMRWTRERNGGFCDSDVQPWIKPSENREQNVADETQDPQSVLNFYRALLKLRKEHDALRKGEIIFPQKDLKGTLIFTRTYEDETFLICCNLTGEWIDRRGEWPKGRLVLSNCKEPQLEGLTPYEADIWLCLQ